MRKSIKGRVAIVYMATNVANGHFYVGVTTRTLKQREAEHLNAARRRDHNGAFLRALIKYGRGGFRWTVLKSFETPEEAFAEEIRLIADMRPRYNATKGGDHAP